MGDHHALGSVDDEGAVLAHDGEVAHKDFALVYFAGLLDYQPDIDAEGGGIGGIPVPALGIAVAGFIKVVIEEMEFHALAGEILNRRDFIKEFAQTFAFEPLEAVNLRLNKPGHLQHRWDAGEPMAFRSFKFCVILGASLENRRGEFFDSSH